MDRLVFVNVIEGCICSDSMDSQVSSGNSISRQTAFSKKIRFQLTSMTPRSSINLDLMISFDIGKYIRRKSLSKLTLALSFLVKNRKNFIQIHSSSLAQCDNHINGYCKNKGAKIVI